MNPQALVLLTEVIEAGNFTLAARRLKMTRANLSYHLAQLERETGVQLVRRTTRRLEPTDAGLRMAEAGRSVRQAVIDAQEAMSDLRDSLRGRVRLSVPSGYGQFVMAPWLLGFKREYPGVVLDVTFENRVQDLLQHEVDIAVRVMGDPPQSLVARDMGRVRYVACATPEFLRRQPVPQRLADLYGLPIISADAVGRELRLTAEHGGERYDLAVEPTLVSENFSFLRDAILTHLGIGIVPDYLVADALVSGQLQAILPDWKLRIFGTRLWMLYMSNRSPTRAMATLVGHLLERCRAEVGNMDSPQLERRFRHANARP